MHIRQIKKSQIFRPRSVALDYQSSKPLNRMASAALGAIEMLSFRILISSHLVLFYAKRNVTQGQLIFVN
jgi:hypothetical protein